MLRALEGCRRGRCSLQLIIRRQDGVVVASHGPVWFETGSLRFLFQAPFIPQRHLPRLVRLAARSRLCPVLFRQLVRLSPFPNCF